MTFDRIHKMLNDVEQPRDSLRCLLARYHDDRQSHWQGGDSWETPSPEVAAVFQQLEVAQKAIDEADHRLFMLLCDAALAEPLP
jgi:hypothetical protein